MNRRDAIIRACNIVGDRHRSGLGSDGVAYLKAALKQQHGAGADPSTFNWARRIRDGEKRIIEGKARRLRAEVGTELERMADDLAGQARTVRAAARR